MFSDANNTLRAKSFKYTCAKVLFPDSWHLQTIISFFGTNTYCRVIIIILKINILHFYFCSITTHYLVWNCCRIYTVFHKKRPVTIVHNFGKFWPIFQFFTLGLSSDYVRNWSLKIPSHLKRVDTLPCDLWNVNVRKLLTIWNKCLV